MYILIKADYNDADYVYTIRKTTPEELEKILPVITAIKNCKDRHNWPNGERDSDEQAPTELYPELTEDQIDYFDNVFVPCSENGIHTIKEIKIISIEKVLYGEV